MMRQNKKKTTYFSVICFTDNIGKDVMNASSRKTTKNCGSS